MSVSAFSNCGRAVAHVRGSYGPILLQKSVGSTLSAGAEI